MATFSAYGTELAAGNTQHLMTIASAAPPLARHGLRRAEYIALASLVTATIAISIDTILPAFDEISETYGLDESGLSVSLSVTLFFAALGIGNLLWGPLADRFGRRPMMFISLGTVVIGSVLTSFAPTFEIFLAGRVLWGIAAAGPRTIVLAITRDCYDGDAMSRIMSLTIAVFLVVPILAPGLGTLLLTLGSWRLTTLSASVLAVIGAAWFARISETLQPNDVLPLEFGRVGRAAKAVVTTRSTALFTLAAMMTYASFIPWLGSSPTLIGDIYGFDSSFALIFGANGLLMALGILFIERMVRRYSTFPIVKAQVVGLIVVAVIYVVVALSFDGVPPFGVWFVLASLLLTLNSSSSPLFQSMAMGPMKAIAGTAASVTGAIVFIGGAILGSITDSLITDTVTPFGFGFLVYGLVIAGATLAARTAVAADDLADDVE